MRRNRNLHPLRAGVPAGAAPMGTSQQFSEESDLTHNSNLTQPSGRACARRSQTCVRAHRPSRQRRPREPGRADGPGDHPGTGTGTGDRRARPACALQRHRTTVREEVPARTATQTSPGDGRPGARSWDASCHTTRARFHAQGLAGKRRLAVAREQAEEEPGVHRVSSGG